MTKHLKWLHCLSNKVLFSMFNTDVEELCFLWCLEPLRKNLNKLSVFGFCFCLLYTLKIYVKEKKYLYFFKTLCIYAAYNFIRRNCNGPSMVLHVPHISLLEVGMSYLDWFRIFMPCFQFQSTWTSHGSFDISLLEVGIVCFVWIGFSL